MSKPYYCGECSNLYYDEKEHMFWCDLIDNEPEIVPWYQPKDCPYNNNNKQLSFSDLINTMPNIEKFVEIYKKQYFTTFDNN